MSGGRVCNYLIISFNQVQLEPLISERGRGGLIRPAFFAASHTIKKNNIKNLYICIIYFAFIFVLYV